MMNVSSRGTASCCGGTLTTTRRIVGDKGCSLVEITSSTAPRRGTSGFFGTMYRGGNGARIV